MPGANPTSEVTNPLRTRIGPEGLVPWDNSWGDDGLASDLGVVHPDAFFLDQLDLYPGLAGSGWPADGGQQQSPSIMGPLRGWLAPAGIATFADEVRRDEFV